MPFTRDNTTTRREAFCRLLWAVVYSFFHLSSHAGPSLFLIGDSTMAEKPVLPENPERGWGQLLGGYFHSELSVHNHAVNGRSSKSFRDEGRWEKVLGQLKKGDFVLIQFGHNDQKPDVARHTDPFTTYTQQLKEYVIETQSVGAYPILATSVVRRRFDDQGKLKPTHGDYPQAVRQLARELRIPCLDMTKASAELLTRLGPKRSKALFLWTLPGEYARFPEGNEDNTHFNALGATRMCDLVVAMIAEKIPALAQYLHHP